jgi:hypothetical protein
VQNWYAWFLGHLVQPYPVVWMRIPVKSSIDSGHAGWFGKRESCVIGPVYSIDFDLED